MESGQSLDEEEVQILLLDGGDSVDEAIEKLHSGLGPVILRILKRYGPGLDADDLLDAYQETLWAIAQAARQGRYEADSSLMPYVATIARNEARDAMRRIRSRSKAEVRTEDQVLTAVADALASDKFGPEWDAMDQEGRHQVMSIIRQTISELSRIQRLVATAWADLYFHEPAPWETIAVVLRDRFGGQYTVVAAKGAWKEAVKKIKDALTRAGYHI